MSQVEMWDSANPFDVIRQVDAGRESWSARDLMELLGYDRWERFEDAISRAKTSAQNIHASVADHFPEAGKMIKGGRWGEQSVTDYLLTRYACYLVAMNGDPRKPEIARAQSYFAIQTRKAEIAEGARAAGAAAALPSGYAAALRELADAVETKELADEPGMTGR